MSNPKAWGSETLDASLQASLDMKMRAHNFTSFGKLRNPGPKPWLVYTPAGHSRKNRGCPSVPEGPRRGQEVPWGAAPANASRLGSSGYSSGLGFRVFLGQMLVRVGASRVWGLVLRFQGLALGGFGLRLLEVVRVLRSALVPPGFGPKTAFRLGGFRILLVQRCTVKPSKAKPHKLQIPETPHPKTLLSPKPKQQTPTMTHKSRKTKGKQQERPELRGPKPWLASLFMARVVL